MDLVTLDPPGPLLDLVTLFPTWTSPGSGDSGPQFGLTWTWCLSSPLGSNSELLNLAPPRLHPDLVTLVPTMPQFDLMNLVLTWASHGPGTQLDRVALVSTRGSPDTADCGLILCLTRTK